MALFREIKIFATAIREFVVPTYRPERYYMRGPGPACARRLGALDNSRLGALDNNGITLH